MIIPAIISSEALEPISILMSSKKIETIWCGLGDSLDSGEILEVLGMDIVGICGEITGVLMRTMLGIIASTYDSLARCFQ